MALLHDFLDRHPLRRKQQYYTIILRDMHRSASAGNLVGACVPRAPTKGRISNFYKSTVGAEHRAARKSDAQGTAPLHRPRTDIRPLSASSTTIQPLYNRFSTPRQLSETSTHPQPSFNRHTNHLSIAFQPPPTRSSPKPPPIRRDKAGHPHPSHTAPRRLATMPKHGKGGRAEARPPHYAPPPPTKH